MNRTKKQHYLPQFYLRYFADETENLCVVDADSEKDYYIVKVRDAAQGRYYYDFAGDEEKQSLENFLGLLESYIAPEYEKIVAQAEIDIEMTDEQKILILNFVKLQFIRSDWIRKKIPHKILSEIFKPDHLANSDKLVHAYMIKEGMFLEAFDYLYNFSIRVLKCPKNVEIFTSSFPIFLHKASDLNVLLNEIQSGLQNKSPFLDANLFFPLTSNICLYIYNPMKENNLKDDNWYSVFVTCGISFADRKIYFKPQDFSKQVYSALKPLLNTNDFHLS
ncbi:DUF4238 domain-containing protein [Deinococcus sp.]|uniref:DUF4238 domain-containing protein n=1 Tax=Deinococcus sp. TaxID=47478 RepID=UPI003C7B0240